MATSVNRCVAKGERVDLSFRVSAFIQIRLGFVRGCKRLSKIRPSVRKNLKITRFFGTFFLYFRCFFFLLRELYTGSFSQLLQGLPKLLTEIIRWKRKDIPMLLAAKTVKIISMNVKTGGLFIMKGAAGNELAALLLELNMRTNKINQIDFALDSFCVWF